MLFQENGLKRDLQCQSSGSNYICDKVFKNGPNKIYGGQPL